MKNSGITFFYLLLLGSFAPVWAQNSVATPDPLDQVLQLGDTNNPFMGKFEDQIPSQVAANNNIFIEQAGYGNVVKSNTAVAQSDITLLQNGTSNQIILDISTLTATQNISQRGRNNIYAEYVNVPNAQLERSIQQQGTGQQLIIHGSNELTENMQLQMQGNSKTIVIRNFN